MNLASEFGFTAEQLEALSTRAIELAHSGDLEGAAVILKGLIALDPHEPGYHSSLGSMLQQEGKCVEAEAAYDAALALWPRAPLALLNRGELRCLRGDLKRGIEDLRVAARLKAPGRTRAEALLRRFSG